MVSGATTRETAKARGYVETVFGRRLWLPEIRSSQAGRRQGAERAAINAPMQGTAADLIKSAMIAVQRWLDGEGLARFSVVRAAPGKMPEGRIQYCIHHTPELLWQDRWIDHPNGAIAIDSVIIVVSDMAEALPRYQRFTGRRPQSRPDGTAVLALDHGTVILGGPETPLTGTPPKTLPFVAAYGVKVRDLKATADLLAKNGVAADATVSGVISVEGGPALGGTVVFHA